MPWNPADHPQYPKGTPGGKGGEFAPKAGGLKKTVGPFTVDDSAEFTMNDLNKIGPTFRDDGIPVFVDYDGTTKQWVETPIIGPGTWNERTQSWDYAPVTNIGTWRTSPKAKQRRQTLRAMVTRRDNKRRVAAMRAQREVNTVRRMASRLKPGSSVQWQGEWLPVLRLSRTSEGMMVTYNDKGWYAVIPPEKMVSVREPA